MLSLFYRAWADTQPTVSFDRPETDRFNVYVGALCGLGMPSLWNRDAVPDLAKFHYAGSLGRPDRNARGFASNAGGFFQVAGHDRKLCRALAAAVRIQPAAGWEKRPPDTGLLGVTAVIG